MAKRRFYRVETLDTGKGETISGLMDSLWSMLYIELGIKKLDNREENAKQIDKKYAEEEAKGNLAAIVLMRLIKRLCDMPVANDIKESKDDVCLFMPRFFLKNKEMIAGLSELSLCMSEKRLCYVYRVMNIDDEEIYYEDQYQVVIPRSVYEQKKGKYHQFKRRWT